MMKRTVWALLVAICVIFTGCFALSAEADPGNKNKNDKGGGHVNLKKGTFHPNNSGKITVTPANNKTHGFVIAPRNMYYVRVVSVIAGSILEVAFSDSYYAWVRFIGVDIPGSGPFGTEALRYTRARLGGKKIWLWVDDDPWDSNGRILGYVWTTKPGHFDDEREMRQNLFNARLILNGYGRSVTIPSHSWRSERFVVFQDEARGQGRGLWKKR